MPDKLVRILSIDGGGIRGILAGMMLVELEKQLQQVSDDADVRIADYVDLVAGTSTGGILGCALLIPDDNGRPRFTAREVVDLYLERGDEIFDISLWKKITSVGGLNDERYDAGELEDALQDYFGDNKLSDLLRPCVITSYDIKRRRVHLFTQHDAKAKPSHNFLARDVARATSAAPTFFEPPLIKSDANITYPLVDGGMFANNPTLIAYSEARQMNFEGRASQPSAADMAIMSLATADPDIPGVRTSFNHKEAKDWGLASWAPAVIDILMSAAEDTTAFHLQKIYETLADAHRDQYVRLCPLRGDASRAMDDASDENLRALEAAGRESAEKHQAAIRSFAELLVANA